MKFINPSVTDRPTESTNNSIPKANPSKRMMAICLITIAGWPRRYWAGCSGSFASGISAMIAFCSVSPTLFTSRM